MRLRKRVLSSPRRNRTKRVPRVAYGHVTTRVHEHDNRTHVTLTPPSLLTGTRLFYDATSKAMDGCHPEPSAGRSGLDDDVPSDDSEDVDGAAHTDSDEDG